MAMSDAGYIDEGTLTAQLGLNPSPARKVENPRARRPSSCSRRATTPSARIWLPRRPFLTPARRQGHQPIWPTRTEHRDRASDGHGQDSLASTKEMFGSFPDVKITPTTSWAAGDAWCLRHVRGHQQRRAVDENEDGRKRHRRLRNHEVRGRQVTDDYLSTTAPHSWRSWV
jgi:hypothetical protein